LAAKLLGWKIDIKSEEEKRQEVESQMAALVAPGAPVSVLIEYGLAENVVEKLLETGIGTIEKLGGMTPEELEAIQGIGPDMVEQIQVAVNGYYSQFEDPAAEEAAAPEAAPEDEIPVETETSELSTEAEQSGTIEGAGSPTHKPSEGTDPEGTVPEEGTPEDSGR
jgi:N utilization substance protein A